jgi:response regulator RpfG family c-di-GMP phosphodiesterase
MASIKIPLIERLRQEGRLSPDQYEGVLHHIQRSGAAPEEALIETSILTEAELLKYLAKLYNTRFVSTDRLSKADIDPATLGTVPRKIAEQFQVFPVLFDAANKILSVVTADPGNLDVVSQVQLGSSAREVRLFVGRPAAVKAAISKFYGGDIHAFSHIDRQQIEQYKNMLNVFERNLVSEEALSSTFAVRERKQERVVSEGDIDRGAARANAPTVTGGGVSLEDYQETLAVLISLLENGRGELRGHSAVTSRLARKIAERIGVSTHDQHAIAVACLLHDVGKSGNYHLTALNVAEYEGHKVAAQKSHLGPMRLFEGVRLPSTSETAISSMYERFDGKGLPNGHSGKDIPLGARILAIADTYADLTGNSRNPFRKVLSPLEACEALGRYKGKVFDPNLVDLFKHVMLGEDLRAKLLADRPTVLVIDEDAEESTVLELRLLETGHEVRSARAPEQAIQLLSKGDIDLVVSEWEFRGATGADLLAHVRTKLGLTALPWIFLTRDARKESVSRAFELSASDYVVKPTPTDVVVAKLRRVLESGPRQSARGVAGSLREMGFPELVQVLSQSRKSGALKVRVSNGDAGEVHFDEGQIVNAMWTRSRGEEAFFQMCALTDGDFSFDPAFKATARVIQASAESLLLEGMRRMDENSARA